MSDLLLDIPKLELFFKTVSLSALFLGVFLLFFLRQRKFIRWIAPLPFFLICLMTFNICPRGSCCLGFSGGFITYGNTDKITLRQLQFVLETYRADCGGYPTTLTSLLKNTDQCKNWGPDPYYAGIPKDFWGRPFVYELRGENYTIKTYGRYGLPDGETPHAQDYILEDGKLFQVFRGIRKEI